MSKKKEEWGSAVFGGALMRRGLAQPAGFLLVLVGWAQFLNYFRFFLVRFVSFSYTTTKALEYLTNGLLVLVLLFSANYLFVHRSRLHTTKVRYILTIWTVWLLCMVAVNLILHNVLGHVVFELQHTLFMLLTGLAILLTGNILADKSMRWGGIVFTLLAFGVSWLHLREQMLAESLGWLIGVAYPGFLLWRRR